MFGHNYLQGFVYVVFERIRERSMDCPKTIHEIVLGEIWKLQIYNTVPHL